jgi:hypothetical protein
MKISCLSLATVLVTALGGVIANDVAAAGPKPTLQILIPAGPELPAAAIAVERLQAYAGVSASVIYGGPPLSPAGGDGTTIVLGTASDSPELMQAWAAHPGAKADSYLIRTVKAGGTRIIASGRDARGTLFAAYQLADRLKAGADLDRLDVFRQPRIAERFVSFGATTHGRKRYVPEQHWKTLRELPAFGYNGIVIYPGGGTPIGRRSSPVVEAADGGLSLEPENTARWHEWFSELKKYQLELMMTLPPLVPPDYAHEAIADFYSGGPEPAGYLTALRSHFRRYLELLQSAYPEIDRFMFNSTEGATFGRNERFFNHPAPNRFPLGAYRRNNEAVMRAYFETLADFYGPRRNRVYFWTHSFGLTSDGIRQMREILFSYPWVTIIEDDFWNNNLWPHDLPAMAYLPPDLRQEVSEKNPFALFQIATDGEYHGGGALPNAYPGSHIRSAREAVARNARMVIQRLDLHDRTPYGTAFGTMKIVPYAASLQWWDPTPPEQEIWRDWAESRFGRAAAPAVVQALQESHSVLIDGLSGSGLDLLCVGSEFAPRLWQKDQTGVTRFFLFGRPGRPLTTKQPGDVITSEEFTVWQMHTRSLSIAEFRRNQDTAAAAIRRGRDWIEGARPDLTPADYAMLRDVFSEGARVLGAVRRLGELAYATNLVVDNFDAVANPPALFDQRAAELEGWLRDSGLIPEMRANLAKILQSYRDIVAAKR